MRHLRKPYRKFFSEEKKVKELQQSNDRFKRIFSEYDSMSEELWKWENEKDSDVPDDFMDAVKLQTSYLEDEISHWLIDESEDNPST